MDFWFHSALSRDINDQGWRWAGCIYTGKPIGFKPELKFALFGMPANMTACVCYVYLMLPNHSDSQHSQDGSHGGGLVAFTWVNPLDRLTHWI